MSTNAMIYAKQADGKVKGIYLHWDGYPAWAGKHLLQGYNTKEKVNELVSLGDLSSLGTSSEPAELIKRFGFNAPMYPERITAQKRGSLPKEWIELPKAERHRLLWDYQNNLDKFTVAYARDKGEKYQTETVDSESILKKREPYQQYEYYWNGQKWFWRSSGEFAELTDEVCGRN